MLAKQTRDIGIGDLRAFAENRALEDRYIDFKEGLIGNSDREKREFLADVSAFANASGGDIVLGIREKDGTADEFVGVRPENVDAEKLRLSQIVQHGLEPRLSGVEISSIPDPSDEGGTGALLIRVPRSWAAPHRVTFNKDMNFYVRGTAGKSPMNVDDLREAFAGAQAFSDRVKAFRRERLKLHSENEEPVMMGHGARLIVHLISVNAFRGTTTMQFNSFASGPRLLGDHGGWSTFQCADGQLSAPPGKPSDPVSAYTLVLRSGIIEACETFGYAIERTPLFDLKDAEHGILRTMQPFLSVFVANGIDFPVVYAASLVQVWGYEIAQRAGIGLISRPPRTAQIMLPDILLDKDDVKKDPFIVLRPVLDRLSNAFGLDGCLNHANGAYRYER